MRLFFYMCVAISLAALVLAGPDAYAFSLKKKANEAKNKVTQTASDAKQKAKQEANKLPSTAEQKAQNAKTRVQRADQQAKAMTGQLADVFGKITE